MLHSGWGARFLDYDNDGWKDLFVAQGHVMDNIQLTQPSLRYSEPMLLMRNERGKFRDVSGQSGDVFQRAVVARGAAFGDLNNDGWLEAVINCRDEGPVIIQNLGGNGNHWLTINTIGSASNRDGIGAAIRVVSPTVGEQYAMYRPQAAIFRRVINACISDSVGQSRESSRDSVAFRAGPEAAGSGRRSDPDRA